MPEEKNLDEIVLYHGSLAELNERLQNKGYEARFDFADELNFITQTYLVYESKKNWLQAKRELLEKGYDGIVNMRTVVFAAPADARYNLEYAIEGTPIVRTDR